MDVYILLKWIEVFSAFLLLSDAFLSETVQKHIEVKLKNLFGDYCEEYKRKRRIKDLSFTLLIIGIWMAVFGFTQFGAELQRLLLWLGFSERFPQITLLLLAAWGFGVILLLSMAIMSIKYLDSALRLLISFPFFFLLLNAPKSPLYTIGFALLFLSFGIELKLLYTAVD